MKTIPNFLPSTRGFSFGNGFPAQPDKVLDTPLGKIAIGNASNGLCGGMVFAVRDYYEAGIVQPSGAQPSIGQPLYDFIVDRLFASFGLPAIALKYYDWMCTADHDTLLKTGVSRRTIVDEWPRIKAEIDANRPCCLGLVTVFSLNPGDLGQNHQVMAYGYDLDAAQNLTLRLYDPNSPMKDGITLSMNLSRPAASTPISHNVNIAHPIRGFFVVPYARVAPPQIDDADLLTFVAPQSMAAGSTATVTVQIRNTGTTTWVPSGANPSRLGSQRPQDSALWGRARVDLPGPVSPQQSVDLAFPVTAPNVSGAALCYMGWRMVCEGRQWFGELESRTISVTGLVTPPDPCQVIREQILEDRAEIADFQEQLRQAVGQGKALLAAQIKRKQAEIAQLKQQAVAQGCPPMPG